MRKGAIFSFLVFLVQSLIWPLLITSAAAGQEVSLPLSRAKIIRPDWSMGQKIESVLQKLGENLIFIQTRGAKEVVLYRNAAPAVVLVVTNESIGTGVIIDRGGHVITNWHVIQNQSDIVVVLKPKDSTDLKKELAFEATVEKVDEIADLALLKINSPPQNLMSLRLASSLNLAVGQDVHAIGHPTGGSVWTYTKGIISQIRTDFTWSASDRDHIATVIQTQTPVNPGNSGGPLLDDSGRVIGINSFRSQGQGLNYAVASDVVQAFLRRKGSRELSTRQASPKLQCPESYDTVGRGWTDIVGCYQSANTPPPDLWFAFQSPEQLAYSALGSKAPNIIDTVIKSADQWQSLDYYMDLNCNGIVDVIGHKGNESSKIESYQLPAKTLRLTSLAKELDRGLKRQTIPYSTVRICQPN